MTEFVEVITDILTGERVERPLTDAEIAEIVAKRAAGVAADRADMRLSFAQLLIGLVTEGWITEAEGDAWADGTLPPAIMALISTLPTDQQFAARTRAKRPSEVLRLDPMVQGLGAAQGKSDDELDAFFRTYMQV